MQKDRTENHSGGKVSSRALIMTAAVLIPLTAICVGIACGRVTTNTNATSTPSVAENKNESVSQAASRTAGGRDELRIELTNSGFMPSEVTHASGTFAIAVENTSVRDDYTLRLKAQDGTVLKEIQVQKGSVAWSVSLQPGRYVLADVNHPQRVCRINVQ